MAEEIDRLSEIQADAFDKAANAEATAKAFRAIETLTAVFDRVRSGQITLDHPEELRKQLQWLTKVMNDWYASQR